MEIRKIKSLMELVLLSIFWLLGLYDSDRPVTLLFQNSLYMFLASQQITRHWLCTGFQASDCLGATIVSPMVEVDYIFVPEILSPNRMWISSGCGSEGFLTTQLMFYDM